jgi:hypothetical protein
MPKFIKLKLKNVPKSRSISAETVSDDFYSFSWKLVLDNRDDFFKWAEYDAEASAHAFLSLAGKNSNSKGDYTHLGGLSDREAGLATGIKLAAHAADGKKIYPMIEAAKMNDLKQAAMLGQIMAGTTICIHENGVGWCVLESFIKTWDAEIVEELEKEGFAFPVDNEELKAETIVLENAPKEDWRYKYILERVKQRISDTLSIGFIFSLKETDERYVFKAMNNAKNIYIESEFEDEKQISSVAKALMNMPEMKTLYINASKTATERLKSHKDFDMVSAKHKIILSDR